MKVVGMWRSLVAHWTGGPVVGGSNPLIPTRCDSMTLPTFLVPVGDFLYRFCWTFPSRMYPTMPFLSNLHALNPIGGLEFVFSDAGPRTD